MVYLFESKYRGFRIWKSELGYWFATNGRAMLTGIDKEFVVKEIDGYHERINKNGNG